MKKKIKDLTQEEILTYLRDRMCNYCPYNDECPKEIKPSSSGNPIFPPCDDFPEQIESFICDNWKDCVENDPNDIDYQKEEVEVEE